MIRTDIIADRLLQLRGNKNRAEVAKAIGVSYSALSNYETGQRVPRDEVKVALAIYYDKSVEDIFFKN